MTERHRHVETRSRISPPASHASHSFAVLAPAPRPAPLQNQLNYKSPSVFVLSRNDLTTHLNNDVSRLSNRDIVRIILLYRVKGKPVVEIARDFQVTRQRVYQLITQFKASGKYPTNRKTGRKPQPIDERTEQLILEKIGRASCRERV